MRIDAHVHFRDGRQAHKETIAHGMELAKDQGIDAVFDMPNTDPPILRKADVENRLKLVPEEYRGGYFLYVGAAADEDQLKEAVDLVLNMREVIGIKMFAGKSTGNLAVISEDDQRKIYCVLSRLNYKGVLSAHCEKESLMRNIFDPQNPYTHALSRPKEAEIESIRDQIKFAKEAGFQGNLHICHVSCPESVELVDQARAEMKITCAITPHHLLWSNEKLKGDHGLLYKTNPPLRGQSDVDVLREMLKQGKIDWIETDHAPHTIGEKLHSGFPSGYPSLYLYRELVEKFLPEWGLNEEQVRKLTRGNIIKTFGNKL